MKKALTPECFQRRRADLWFGKHLTHNAGRNHGQNYGEGRPARERRHRRA
jgi:hypothetical protein